jgi:hypothetical protein
MTATPASVSTIHPALATAAILPDAHAGSVGPVPDGDPARSPFGTLAYLYVGSSDVGTDLVFYQDALGATVRWRFRAFGADVAAVDLGAGPPVLLASHRPAPSVLPIWVVPDVRALVEALRGTGWDHHGVELEIPDGVVFVFRDPSGNELAALQIVRPGALDAAWADPTNPRAVRDEPV